MANTYEDIAQGFIGAMNTYPGTKAFGQSFYDQYRNGRSGYGYIKGIGQDDLNALKPEQRALVDTWGAGAKSSAGSALAGGIISGLNGVATIGANAMRASEINDTTAFQNQLDDLSMVGIDGYDDFGEIARDYRDTNFNYSIDYDDIRGMSTGQKIGNVSTSALSGASTGMQIAGPLGAAAGAVIGAGASLYGIMQGDQKAKSEEIFLNNKANMAANMAMDNLSAASERLTARNDRRGVVNAAAKGGGIDRRRQVSGYIDSRTKGVSRKVDSSLGGMTRTYCNGGVRFRIRTK